MTLQEIKDNYAKKEGYKSWDSLIDGESYSLIALNEHIDEIMKLYAMECLKQASENADLVSDEGYVRDSVYLREHEETYFVNKNSIYNESNLI